MAASPGAPSPGTELAGRTEPVAHKDDGLHWPRDFAGRRGAGLQRGLVLGGGGFFFVASCSHLVDPPLFAEQVRRGLRDAERSGRILRSSGAALDHPVHPSLPETAYLKAMVLQLD